jgi:hypothetical protein
MLLLLLLLPLQVPTWATSTVASCLPSPTSLWLLQASILSALFSLMSLLQAINSLL